MLKRNYFRACIEIIPVNAGFDPRLCSHNPGKDFVPRPILATFDMLQGLTLNTH